MASESKLILCPYCGHTQTAGERCQECGGLFEPLSRKATQISMGPWYIRDKARPFRPGCSYDVLVKQIKAGRIKATTVIRGPTTRQFWSVARNVPGVAHHLGYCHKCGTHVSATDTFCPTCSEPFHAIKERNELGLQYPTDAAAAAAQRAMDREAGSPGSTTNGGESEPAAPGADLLGEVLGSSRPKPGKPRESPPPPPPRPPSVEQSPAAAPSGAPAGPRSRLLNFEEDTSARPARATGGGARKVESLDFSPSDDSGQKSLEPKRRRMSMTMIVLFLANVVLVLGVLVLIIAGRQKNDSPQAKPTPPVPQAPSNPDRNHPPPPDDQTPKPPEAPSRPAATQP